MQLLVTLLPSLFQKYKNLDRKTIVKIIKKFVIATLWLGVCYVIPNISTCMISKYSPYQTRVLNVLSFALGASFCAIDTPSRLK